MKVNKQLATSTSGVLYTTTAPPSVVAPNYALDDAPDHASDYASHYASDYASDYASNYALD